MENTGKQEHIIQPAKASNNIRGTDRYLSSYQNSYKYAISELQTQKQEPPMLQLWGNGRVNTKHWTWLNEGGWRD